MSKMNVCNDGVLVVDKVLSYQQSRSVEDYLPIYYYYNNYKDKWHSSVQDYMDRTTFESEFDFKLYRAVDTFDEDQARELCRKNNWSFAGSFNRWFYAVLCNWKSNIKTSAFRQKKRPSVQCPVCGRKVSKINEAHLAHFKTKADLPKFVLWKGDIYSVALEAGAWCTSWGKWTKKKMDDLDVNGPKQYMSDKKRVKWPWYLKSGERGVLCPFTKKIVKSLDNDYIRSLPKKYNRYAKPFTWQEFVEEFPHPMLIQAEIYSLDYDLEEDNVFKDSIKDRSSYHVPMGHDDVVNDNVSIEYESVFFCIESCVSDKTDQDILKLFAIGYSEEDIAIALDLTKKEVKQRKREIKTHSKELKQKLIES